MGLISEIRLVSHARDFRGRSRVPRSAEQWAPAAEPKEFPTGWARSAPARIARHGVRRGAMTPLVNSQVKVEVYGADRLDGVTGPVIAIANHSSHLDAPLVLQALPERLAQRTAVGAAADYFFDARWRATVTALVFNAFPVERLGSRRLRSIAPRLIDDGWTLLLFPEGTRSQDGWMRSFRLGTAALACQTSTPVVPIAIRGAYAAMPRGRNWPKPARPRIAVHIGAPLHPSSGEAPPAFSNRMYAALTQLWGEEELGWWGALRAAERDQLPTTTGPKAAAWRRNWESTRALPDPHARRSIWKH